jgi:hypothetical protein
MKYGDENYLGFWARSLNNRVLALFNSARYITASRRSDCDSFTGDA